MFIFFCSFYRNSVVAHLVPTFEVIGLNSSPKTQAGKLMFSCPCCHWPVVYSSNNPYHLLFTVFFHQSNCDMTCQMQNVFKQNGVHVKT